MEPGFLERAIELAERGRGTTHPNPIVGAVVVAGGEVVGEGWHERKGGPHAEVVALEAAGERARGATVYVTLEPCAHHGTTPPCVDALVAAGVARVVVGQDDPNPDARRRARAASARPASRSSSPRASSRSAAASRSRSGARGSTKRRPFVTYKVAVTLDGRVRVPGSRWVTGRGVAAARARAARAVRCGGGRHGHRALGQPAARRARRPGPRGSRAGSRSAAARCPRDPSSSCARARSREELEALAADGVQSLLLEGGPTLAAAFLEQGLVDKLLVFVAPTLSGDGPGMLAGLPRPLELTRWRRAPIGEDVLLQAYLHEP